MVGVMYFILLKFSIALNVDSDLSEVPNVVNGVFGSHVYGLK